MNVIETEKEIAGKIAADFIKSDMIVGLGTGSTVTYAIKEIGERVKKGLKIKAVSTSKSTSIMAQKLNIPLISIDQVDSIDLTIDGADEIDPNFNGIKGGGGALLVEKIIASISKENIWVINSNKLVNKLGKFPLPIEVVPFAITTVMKRLEKKNFKPKVRKLNDMYFITDNNNYIIDLYLGSIKDPKCLEIELNMIPGIIDNGLFLNIVDTVVVGKNNEYEILENKFKAKFF
ncbi:MAG: ribose-5-phosphate isomerase RpiA [Spirochaetes bacterium]|nr:ribose-5-phosphate isomerase RpiA [Spirochaetota bacterium]